MLDVQIEDDITARDIELFRNGSHAGLGPGQLYFLLRKESKRTDTRLDASATLTTINRLHFLLIRAKDPIVLLFAIPLVETITIRNALEDGTPPSLEVYYRAAGLVHPDIQTQPDSASSPIQ